MSRRVLAVVEGQTEFSVLNSTVVPHLSGFGVYLYPKVVGKPGHKGGVYREFETVAKEILNLFKQEPTSVVTTFFDFYCLPEDWPGVAKAKEARSTGLMTSDVAKMVEESWKTTVAQKAAEFDRTPEFL